MPLWVRAVRVIFAGPMFGIGAGELFVILIVILIAVGPDKMPTMMKTVGKGMRELRRTTRELRSTVGIDDIMGDAELSDPLGLRKPPPPKPMPKPVIADVPRPPRRSAASLDDDEIEREQPSRGVDIAFAEAHAARVVAAKEAALAHAESVADEEAPASQGEGA